MISAVTLVVLGPTVWEKVLLHPVGSAPFPYGNPALFSMIIAFVGIWLFSVLDRSQTAKNESEAYERRTSAPRPVWVRRAPRRTDGTDRQRSDYELAPNRSPGWSCHIE